MEPTFVTMKHVETVRILQEAIIDKVKYGKSKKNKWTIDQVMKKFHKDAHLEFYKLIKGIINTGSERA